MSPFFRQIGEYLFLKKKDPRAVSNTNMRFMHGMNRISIYIFLLAITFLIIRLIMRWSA